MTLQEELGDLRRALDEVTRALQPLRERSVSSRLVRRLEADLRRMQEDVDDLAADAGSSVAPAIPQVRDFEPIPVPPRDPAVAYDPDSEDEGLAGWRSPNVAPSAPTGRRR
jgi:hypothetical protein